MAYIGKSPAGLGVRARYYYTATGGETSISGADDNGRTLQFTDGEYVDVYLNGVLLVAGTDYGTGTANTISGLGALSSGNIVEIVAYDIFSLGKANTEALRRRYYKTATGGETSISGSDDDGQTITFAANAEIEVYLNGVALVQGDDYNTSAANTVGGLAALDADDIVTIVAYEEFVLGDVVSKKSGGTFGNSISVSGDLTVDTNTLHVDSTNNRVGIGTSSPSAPLVVEESAVSQTAQSNDISVFKRNGDGIIKVYTPNTNTGGIAFGDTDDPFVGALMYGHSDNSMQFYGNNAERMRIDSSGNVMVGKTSTSGTVAGMAWIGNEYLQLVNTETGSGDRALLINRQSANGTFIELRRTNTTIGELGTFNGYPFYGHAAQSGAGLMYVSTSIRPFDCNTQDQSDNEFDLGTGSTRFDDIYATNGTIQTSDQNEKQQIASLTDAEITAAKAISTLFKTFKWNDKVEAKGDAARTHTGVIAQDVQQAMTDAGLDAGDYAFFISTTWWETQTEVPAVEADEENGIEAADAYTRTNTYDTAEEAPEGATERTRLGIRYPELLAFVGAATEQRLANIETRLTALEAE
jgi:hypothetical protein